MIEKQRRKYVIGAAGNYPRLRRFCDQENRLFKRFLTERKALSIFEVKKTLSLIKEKHSFIQLSQLDMLLLFCVAFYFVHSGHSMKSFRDENYIPHTASDYYGEKGLG